MTSIYNRDFTIYKLYEVNKFRNLSFESKFSRLNEFSNRLKKLLNQEAKKENIKERKSIVLDAASEFYNDLLEIYLD